MKPMEALLLVSDYERDLPKQPARFRRFPYRSGDRVFAQLCERGLLRRADLVIAVGPQQLTVEGYATTPLGNIALAGGAEVGTAPTSPTRRAKPAVKQLAAPPAKRARRKPDA